ncbi:MAG: sigma-70 family RNA polymerase sigma factor [Acidobacteriota bacterium]
MSSESSSRDDDAGIVARVLAGDTNAFEGIVSRWQGPLLSLAYRLSRDHSLAEEMAQEALLKVFRNLKRWRGEAKFSTWMFSVALNHYRTRLRRHIPPAVELADAEAVAAAGDLASEMAAASRDSIVRRAVALLPPKYRDTIVVYYFQQQDVVETAATLGTKPGTVKARLHRARKLLKTKLKALGHPLALANREAEA